MSAPLASARVELRRVAKRYPGVLALDGVDLELRAGEIHALAGTNGAGKSTLVRLLGGVERPDSGALFVDGRERTLGSPIEALRAGIAVLHQETHLVPELDVVENVFLGRELRRGLRLDWRAMSARAHARLGELGASIDVRRAAWTLRAAEAQLVGLARALDCEARFVVLDEPTSSLDRAEVERLFAVLRALRERGLGLVFIGHSLEQIFALCERVTVLREGRVVAREVLASCTREVLVRAMLGHDAPAPLTCSAPDAASTARPLLVARGLGRARAIAPFDLDVRPGEVVGLAGLLGSGRSELARLLFGAERADQGVLEVDGRASVRPSPRVSIRAGIALCPEERKSEGIFPTLSVRENIAIVAQRRLSRWGELSPRKHGALARRFMDELGIVAAGDGQAVGTLSGGNQQKVLLARALSCEPRLIVLDEPTRGIDIGAKADVERWIELLAQRGTAVLFISSTLDEVLRRSSRVLVLRDGRVVAEHRAGPELEARVLASIAGERT